MLAGANKLRNFFCRSGLGLGGGAVLFLDGDVDFFAMDLGITRRFYTQAHLASLDLNDDDLDIIVNRDTFA